MLLSILAVLSAATAFAGCALLPVHAFWLLPAFVGLFAGSFLAWIVVYLLLLLLASLVLGVLPVREKRHPILQRFIVETLRALCTLGRVTIHFTGAEQLPEGRFLFVCNHLSMFDPIIALVCLQHHPIVFVSKPENLKLPLVGSFIRHAGFLAIDRENPRNAIRTIHAAAEKIQNDLTSIGVYPEGTRNRTDDGHLLPFHAGVLMIAQKAAVPVVVATVQGTAQIAHNFPFRKSPVRLSIQEVIPAADVASARAVALSEQIRSRMEAALLSNESTPKERMSK